MNKSRYYTNLDIYYGYLSKLFILIIIYSKNLDKNKKIKLLNI